MSQLANLDVIVRDMNVSTSLVKKKTLDQLKDILNDEGTIQALSKNSCSNTNSRIDWNCLFDVVHKCLLEVEEHRRKRDSTISSNLSVQCSSVLTFIVKKACYKSPCIKCSKIIRSFLDVMSVNYLKQNIGGTYVDVLRNVLLFQREYRSDVTHDQWRDLFHSTVELYQTPLTHLDHSSIVELLNLIVMHGSCQSELNIRTRDLYPMLIITFQDNQFCRFKNLHQERLIQLAVTLCSQTAQESRTALCHLGEEIICPLICMYDKFSAKGKRLLHDCLLLQVNAHHPGGSCQGSLSSYAFDWKKWNICLDSMYKLVLAEVDCPLDKKNKNVSPVFLHLAVEVCRQVFSRDMNGLEMDDDDDDEDIVGPSCKRRKVDVGLMTLAATLQPSHDSHINSWLSLSLIGTFITKYPETLKEEEFISLLELVADIQSTCKSDILMKYTCLCCTALLSAEKYCKRLDVMIVNTLWDRIWETMIRTVGLNQNEKESHSLLQALILHDKAKHLSELATMFLNNTFRVSSFSVETLNVLLGKYDLPSLTSGGTTTSSGHKTIKTNFLEWMLPEHNSEMDITVSPSTLADVLLQLSSKTVSNSRPCSCPCTDHSTFVIMLQKMDKNYMISSFEQVVVKETVENLSMMSQSINVDVTTLETIQKLLIHKCRIVDVQQNCDRFNTTNLNNAFYQLSLLVEVWAAFSTAFHRQPLFAETMDSLVKYLSRHIVCQLRSLESCPSVVADVLHKFQALLLIRYPDQISYWLCESIFSMLVKCTVEFVTMENRTLDIENDILESDDFSNGKLKNEDSFSSSLDECFSIETCRFPQIRSKNVTDGRKLHLECLKFLGCICTLGNGQFRKVTELANEILSSVPLVDMESFNGVVWIIQCLIDNSSMDPSVVNLVLIKLKEMVLQWLNDSETTLIILRLLQGMVPHVHRNSTSTEYSISNNCCSLMNGILKCIMRHKFGVKVSVSFIRCLEAVSRVDPTASWSRMSEMPAVEKILYFLDSPSHEIRLAAVDSLKTVITHSAGFMDERWHLKVFSEMSEKIDQSFIVEANLSNTSASDDSANRSASALHAFAAVLLGSPVLYKRSLFQLLKICRQKNLDIDLFKRIMSYIGSINEIDSHALIARNLQFLVREWLDNSFPLQDLAKYLYNSSITTFYTNCMNVLVPELLLRGDDTTLKEIEKLTNKNMMELCESCFSQIMGELLPGLQADDVTALQCRKQLENIISKNGLETLLTSNLPEIIVAVFRKLCDFLHFKSLCGISAVLFPQESTSITYKTAMKCMEYLQRCSPAPETNLFEFLCEKSPKHIQTILLDLVVDIYEAVLLPDKLNAFYHYAVFANGLASDMKMNNMLSVTSHIICCVIHTLIHLIKNSKSSESVLAMAACSFLKYFCELCVPENSSILCKLLILITDTLVLAAKTGGDLGTLAMDVLKFLFIEKCEYFTEGILLIDRLPNDLMFREMQNVIINLKKETSIPNLEEEVSSFLKMRYLSGKQCVENLKSLHRQLSQQKEELKCMFDKLLCSRGFSEDCGRSLLHRLICTLIELAASSDLEVSVHAGYCLGEIGPSDLGTLVLRPDDNLPVINVADMVPLVAECLLDNNIKVQKAASLAMYKLLKYKECNKLKEKDFIMSCGISCSEFLYPFSTGRKFQTLIFGIDNSLPITLINDKILWCPTEDMSHQQWVVKLTSTVLQFLSKGKNFLSNLLPLCGVKATFAEKVLPLFVSTLMNSSTEFGKIIVKCIEDFFENHVRLNAVSNAAGKVCLNKASVRCMLTLVHFLRVHKKLESEDVQWDPLNLNLNYINIAQAAQFCNAHFSSILYVELWSDKWLRTASSEQVYGQSQTALERFCEQHPEEGGLAQKILWEAYLKICDTDALYGCGSSLLLDPSKRTLHYELRGQLDKVILSHDVQLSAGHTENARGLVYALQKAGLHHVLDQYLSSTTNNMCSEDVQYECAWRLGKWDTQLVNSHGHQGSFEQYHLLALRALSCQDKISFTEALSQAHKYVSESLINICLESCKSVYKPLSQFRLIQEMNEFQSIKDGLDFDNILKKWVMRDGITFNQFEDIEPVFWQRIVMLNSASENDYKKNAAEVAARLAGLAREESQLQVAARCLDSFNLCDLPSSVQGLLQIEEASLAWNNGDFQLGKRIMRDLLATLDQHGLGTQNPVMYAQALKLYGDWMVETKSENPQVVINNYYLKALKILTDVGEIASENRLNVYSALAHFADTHYQNLSNYFKSRAYEIKKEWIEKAIQDVENLRKQTNRTRDDDKTITIKQKQSRIDNEEISNTGKQKDKYLSDAVMYYLLCLEHGDSNNLDIFRVASLWLENMLHPSLKVILDKHLFKVPSYKFVPILPQLAPRMSNVKDDFTIKLNKLLIRCAEDHPHHTLPIILALANSYKDQDYSQGQSSNQKRKQESRVLGAQKLVQDLLKHEHISELLQKMNDVYLALISMAYVEPGNGRENDRCMPTHEPLRTLQNVEMVLAPTLTIPVEKSCKYINIIGVVKYEPTYSLVGGINAPKKLTCLGTDGIKRLQLVKGKDDLRQDAVMQQVFTIMNSFLRKSKNTLKRKLLIRTYKVLPLSQRSGIIEWCENTIPILNYLTGEDRRSGAHKKYYSNDTISTKCREIMRSACTKSIEEKLVTYKKICSAIHPVFRYFFWEHFTSPGTWFERRLAYIHSVATSSMIGYVLGLGDRHLLNILIDKSTAEVIHIDFGIAFEMGHVLPTPETVPFRLTRDIVDGMGVCGVEGVFQRSCEKTMSVLREHQTVLLTVLEVLLYDPLYAWTITPSKAYKIQRKDVKLIDESDSVEVNRMAERALLRLQQKLLGTEVGAGVSVSTQVSRLIQEACDPGNLCRLYFGWEPYL